MNPTDMKDNEKDDAKQNFPVQSSFFCWFADEGNAVGDAVGESIKDELWPNPLQFYLNPDVDSDEVDGMLAFLFLASIVLEFTGFFVFFKMSFLKRKMTRMKRKRMMKMVKTSLTMKSAVTTNPNLRKYTKLTLCP